ncbi:MAG: zinc-binding dehydrogenase, partial [Acidimicrobiia bacterium]
LRKGETMVVTTAAGLVGSIAAQLGKLAGARVVGVTGRDYKVRYLLDELRLDQAIDYRAESDLGAAIRKACPGGVDYFFDNTGGSIADTVLAQLSPGGRHTNCGQISSYDTMNWGQSRRFSGQFSIHNFVLEYAGAQRELAALLRNGKLSYRATIFEGLSAAPGALIRLLAGENIGKYLVRVGPDPE